MPRILVADPDHETRELLERVVARLGCEPVSPAVSAQDGHADVDAAVIEPADPQGLRVARALRAARPNLPIVFTSIAPPSEPARGLEPAAYLLKPFRLSSLREALRPLVSGSSPRTAVPQG